MPTDAEIARGHARMDIIERQLDRLDNIQAPTVPKYGLQGASIIHGLLVQNDTPNDGQVALWFNMGSTITDIYIDYTFTIQSIDTAGNFFYISITPVTSYNPTGTGLSEPFGNPDPSFTPFPVDIAIYGADEFSFGVDSGVGVTLGSQYHIQNHFSYGGTTVISGQTCDVWNESFKVNGGSTNTSVYNFDREFASPFMDRIGSFAVSAGGMGRGTQLVYQSIFVGTTGFGSDDILSVPDCASMSLPGPFTGISTGSDGVIAVQ